MNNVYFLDVFMFVFLLQMLFFHGENFLSVLKNKFLFVVKDVFSYDLNLSLSSLISFFTFIILLTCCFGGYFCYSFCICSMPEFTLVYALLAWLTTLLIFISSEKFSIYMSKEGDSFLKTLSMLMIELVSEFSRPIALTVRLTVNIMVGHLISMMLYQGLELFLGNKYIFISIFAILMECFVFFIQSYIFSRLIFLYLNE
uniref:ATP synthase F0 subunit 6 n=1 Tax=Aphelenchoides medicagus TaxID=2306573 RepID=UPI001F1349E8|nr:ATP synthase F0 subunit 6 [Aphelenchoides medicagus]UKS08881.1 ATP synthase F0 subunit 6 [Aphelenchoides medicagus]